MISDFRKRFREESARIDAQVALLPNEAERGLYQEGLEKDAQKEFANDIEALGHEWSDEHTTILMQAILDRQMDPRIPGVYVQVYLQLCSEGAFVKMQADAAEEARQAEIDAQPKPTLLDKAPSVKQAGIVIRNDEEPLTPEQKAQLTPDQLSKSTMKRLKFQAGQSRREHMSDAAVQAMDRGQR